QRGRRTARARLTAPEETGRAMRRALELLRRTRGTAPGRRGEGAEARGADRLPGRPPLILLAPALAGLAFLVLPLLGLLVRAPWSTLGTRLAQPQVLEALRLSLVSAT